MKHSDNQSRLEILVSIINFRTADLTIQCLESVLDDLGDVRAHIVVVDNFSDDGSADKIEAWITDHGGGAPVSLVRSVTNSGFSGGHNQGMAVYEADYYLLLNSDAVLLPGFFKEITKAVQRNPGTGLISPRIEDVDGTPKTSLFHFFSPLGELVRAAETGPVTRMLARYDVPLDLDADIDDIDWVSFACVVVDGSMHREIGELDEGYFLYFEDAEFCLRARRAGWDVATAHNARVVHYQGRSGPVEALAAARKRLPPYYYASRTRFFYQAYGRLGLVAANLCWYVGRVIANLRILTGRNVPRARDAEALDIWTNFFDPLGDRRDADP